MIITYMENVYSTLALGKEREIVKEEITLRKEYAVMYMYYVHDIV